MFPAYVSLNIDTVEEVYLFIHIYSFTDGGGRFGLRSRAEPAFFLRHLATLVLLFVRLKVAHAACLPFLTYLMIIVNRVSLLLRWVSKAVALLYSNVYFGETNGAL